MENVNVVNDTQASVVAMPTEDALEQGGASAQDTEVTARVQSMEENAGFRKMRLENERLKSENERYAAMEIQRQMKEDLEAIRAMDPQVTTLEELGEDFTALIAAGVAAPIAFAALRESKRANLPPAMGAVDADSSGEKTFYSPEEVDALSPAQLSDAGIWARVRASMTKWK